MRKFKYIFLLTLLLFTVTGCFKRDDLEDVNIYTTVYPIKYVTDFLYGYNSKVDSIYPAEIDVDKYRLTKKQIKDYSNGAVFIYNGLSNEKSIARDLLNENNDLKIIDVSQGLEYTNSIQELWMNPRDYLMLAHNIKNGLEEYISNKYIIEEINKNYEKLKVLISGFDVELQLIPDNAEDKNIIVASNTLNFLSKYGFKLTSIDSKEGRVPSNILGKAERLVRNKTVKYIFMLDNQKETPAIKNLVNKGATVIKLRTMTIQNEEELKNNINYKNMMRDNIDAIKKEVYE